MVYLYLYLVMAVITALAADVTARSVAAQADGQDRPVLLAVIVGAVWPLLLVGIGQIALCAVIVRWCRRRNERREMSASARPGSA